MQKILKFIPKWLLLPLTAIFFLIFWPIIFIIIGAINLFGKKTNDSEKVIGAKMIIYPIFGLLIFGVIMEFVDYFEDTLDNIALPVGILLSILFLILAILSKIFPKNKWLNKIEDEPEPKIEKCEFVNEIGEKDFYTIGYEKNGEFDIYWEDIIASKNNKNGILLSDGTKTIDTGVDENDTELINKKCPSCTGDVDRFIYVNNFSKDENDYGDIGWMEVCWKCKKVLYININSID